MPKLPKYVEIVNYFKEKIESGEIANDEPFPPESEICAKFSTSHMTVSRAMNELAVHGFIKRIKGKGTFADDKFKAKIKKSSVRTESITDMIRNAGLEPSAELIKYGIIKGKEAPGHRRSAACSGGRLSAFLHPDTLRQRQSDLYFVFLYLAEYSADDGY